MIGHLIAGALAWRALIIPITAVSLLPESVPIARWRILVIVIALLTITNGALAMGAKRIGVRRFLESKVFLVGDLCLGISLNLWAASLMPAHSLLLPNRDVLGVYLIGGELLWTGIWGFRVGLIGLVLGASVELTMLRINGLALGEYSVLVPGSRVAWITAAFAGGLLVRALAQQGASMVAQDAIKIGKDREQVRLYADMHDTVLNTLEHMVRVGEEKDVPVERRFTSLLVMARRQAGELRRVLERVKEEEDPGEFYEGLVKLGIDFEARTGIRKELVRIGNPPSPSSGTQDAVLGAVTAALQNVERHAGARSVNMLVDVENDRLRLVVRDDGNGFDLNNVRPAAFGIANCILGRLREVGGDARIESSPGSGTKIEMWVPL